MKKNGKIFALILVLIMLFTSYIPVGAEVNTSLFITEVCYNSPDSEDDTEKDLYDYVEIVNISEEEIDLTDASVSYQESGKDIKSCRIQSGATKKVQPGQIVVIVISEKNVDNTESLREAFNTTFGCETDKESFYLATEGIELTNDAEQATVAVMDSEGETLCQATYSPVKYNRDKHSVGFGLSESKGSRCMGLTAMTPGIAYKELYTALEGDYPENLKVMTYNICASGVKSDFPGKVDGQEWVTDASLYIDERYDEVIGVIQREQPDVVCLNELNSEWWHYVELLLCGKNGEYGYSGRSESGSEVTELTSEKWDTLPLLIYKKEKYKLIDEGTFLCPADERGISTINNWAILRNKETHGEFVVMSQHLAAGSTDVRVKVREESAELIVQKIPEIAEGRPVIIMGDYNCSEGSVPYNTFINNGFNDSSRINPDVDLKYSYGGWYVEPDLTPTRDMNKYLPIDIIMLSKDDFDVKSYTVVEEHYPDTGYGYSDHYPVLVELNMRNAEHRSDILPLIVIVAVAVVIVAAIVLIMIKLKKKPN